MGYFTISFEITSFTHRFQIISVEELVCLATWKEGSIRYLIGKISQINTISASDEDQYRCFIYQRSSENGKTIYKVAQSGDATCTGLDPTNIEGSRTMKLTTGTEKHFYSCRHAKILMVNFADNLDFQCLTNILLKGNISQRFDCCESAIIFQ